MREGWFAIPGVQKGDRTLGQQMRGLGPAIAEAKGKSVLDLGCAEACIAFEFMKAGAGPIFACDNNQDLLTVAVKQRRLLPKFQRLRIEIGYRDVRCMKVERKYDIVLALAIIHKLDDPAQGTELVADSCKDLAVIRMPRDANSVVTSKHTFVECDVPAIMRSKGFSLERTEQGPPREVVHYWRR